MAFIGGVYYRAAAGGYPNIVWFFRGYFWLRMGPAPDSDVKERPAAGIVT